MDERSRMRLRTPHYIYKPKQKRLWFRLPHASATDGGPAVCERRARPLASRYSPRRSARIHVAPAIARVSAVSLQLVWLCGSERNNGTHTSSPKVTSIIVSRRVARSAIRLARIAAAANADQTVVATAHNI